jgi:hypothetical protein
MNDERPNYATLRTDEASGLQYITEIGTLKRLYKHPPCRFCESVHYSYSSAPKDNCGCLAAERVSRNDNDEPELFPEPAA